MPYDNKGNWDYAEADLHRVLRLHRRGMSGVYLGTAARWLGAVGVVLLVIAALLALSLGGYYFAGRAVGAGIRDAVSK